MTKSVFESFEKLLSDHMELRMQVYDVNDFTLQKAYGIVEKSLSDFRANADVFKYHLERWAALPFFIALEQIMRPGWHDEMHVPPEYKVREKHMIEISLAYELSVSVIDNRRYIAQQVAKQALEAGIVPAYVWAEKSMQGAIVTFYIVEE